MHSSYSGIHSTYVLRCVVQHHVHELIIPAQHARDTSVGVELDCTRRNVSTMDVYALALCALCHCPRVSSLNCARARSPRRQRFRSERHCSGHAGGLLRPGHCGRVHAHRTHATVVSHTIPMILRLAAPVSGPRTEPPASVVPA